MLRPMRPMRLGRTALFGTSPENIQTGIVGDSGPNLQATNLYNGIYTTYDIRHMI